MEERTLYDYAGVIPTTPPAQIAAAIEGRLIVAKGRDREMLLLAHKTLLDPYDRQSYDRLHGLRGPLTAAEWRDMVEHGMIEQFEIEDDSNPFIELFFTAYFAFLALILTLWLVVMWRFLPRITPEIESIAALYGRENYATIITAILLTLPFALSGYLLLNVFEQAVQMVGRTIMLIVLYLGIGLLLLLLFEPQGLLRVLLAFGYLSFGVLLMRQLGLWDLASLYGPKRE